jgi:hypothetical protein
LPALSASEAVERLAKSVEKAKPTVLAEIYAELFPEKPVAAPPSAPGLAQHIRNGLKAEEIVDLWNVAFPAARNVWYGEEENEIHYNEEVVDYVDALRP